jgi:hypothetical protein
MDEIINKIFKLIGNSNPNKPHSFRDSGKYEYTLSQIGKTLEEDPANLSAISNYKKVFQEEANALLTSIRETAEKTNLSYQYILKNAIASGPTGSITLYKYWTGEEIKHEALPKIEILNWLLDINPPPNLFTMARGFASVQRALYSGSNNISKRILRYQEYILKENKPWDKDHTSDALTTLIQVVGTLNISAKEFGERTKLQKSDFKKLPPHIRKKILKDKEHAKVLLDPTLHNEIWANPLKWKDTQEAISLKAKKDAKAHTKSLLNKAITCIQNRDLSNYILSSFLQSEHSLEYKGKILDAFRNNTAKSQDWFKSKLDRSVPIQCSKLWDETSLSILEFYSSPIGNRISFLNHLDEKKLKSFLKIIHPQDIYALFRYNTLEKRNKSLFQYLRPKIHTFYENKEFRDWLLGGLLLSPKDPPINRINHIWNDKLWEVLSSKDLKQFVLTFPTLLEKLKPRHFESRSVKSLLNKTLKSPQNLEKFIRGLKEKDLEEIRELNQKNQDWLKSIIFKTQPLPKNANKKLSKLIIANPWLLPLDNQVSKEFYTELYNKCHHNESYIVNLKYKTKYHFKELISNNQKITNNILNLVKIYNIKELEESEKIYASKLIKDKIFNEKLKKYLEGDLDFRHLKISLGTIKALVPFVYKQNKDKPLIASAYTLAMSFSPWNLKFIVGLAIKMIKDKDSKSLLDNFYTIKSIPKRKGGLRELHIPNDELKQIQRNLIDYGFYTLTLLPCVQGFSPKTSIVSNATPHTKKELVANIDIDSFFSNCGYKKILKACSLLVDTQYCPYGAKLLAQLCSYNSFLPTGSPTSPVLGNLILSKADRAILTACKKWEITYTRYADDLTFSGGDNTLSILPFVKKIVKDMGFKIKEGKTNVFRKGRRQMVTGLVVNETAHVPRAIRKKIRAAVHKWKTKGKAHWKGKTINKKQLKGRIAFLEQTHKEEAKKLKNLL